MLVLPFLPVPVTTRKSSIAWRSARESVDELTSWLLLRSTYLFLSFSPTQFTVQYDSMTTWCMLSIASSHFILTVSRDFYPKIRRRLGTETTWLDLERPSRLNGSDSQVYYARSIMVSIPSGILLCWILHTPLRSHSLSSRYSDP